MATRKCKACGSAKVITVAEYPALCNACLNRAGNPLKKGDQVVCTVDEACDGTVDRIIDDGFMAVIKPPNGPETYIPTAELVVVATK